MPLYEYKCGRCGTFTAMRKMSESRLAANCDNCGATSERIISVPFFALMASDRRSAYDRNENSAHEPKTIRRSLCGCSGAHKCKPENSQAKAYGQRKTKLYQKSNDFQMQTQRNARPWMLGH